jgi:hypothetical protein
MAHIKGGLRLSESISGIYSALPAVAPSFALPPTHQAPQPAPASQVDTVTLSQAAQVSQMSGMGEGASIIAQSLGIPVAMVDLDLGIVAAQTASKPAAVPVILNRFA